MQQEQFKLSLVTKGASYFSKSQTNDCVNHHTISSFKCRGGRSACDLLSLSLVKFKSLKLVCDSSGWQSPDLLKERIISFKLKPQGSKHIKTSGFILHCVSYICFCLYWIRKDPQTGIECADYQMWTLARNTSMPAVKITDGRMEQSVNAHVCVWVL